MNNWQQFFLLSEWYVYSGVWRFVFSAFLVLLGIVFAKRVTKFVRQGISRLFANKQLVDSPLGMVLEPLLKLSGSGILSSVVYMLILFLFVAWAGEVIGITLFSQIVAMIVAYIPNVLVALVIVSLGMLLSGVVENITKQQFKKVAPQQAVLAGTVASSVTVGLFALMALSELGIGSEFILILFAGFVFALSLGSGIALGFGAKDLVAQSLNQMVQQEQHRRTQSKKVIQK